MSVNHRERRYLCVQLLVFHDISHVENQTVEQRVRHMQGREAFGAHGLVTGHGLELGLGEALPTLILHGLLSLFHLLVYL